MVDFGTTQKKFSLAPLIQKPQVVSQTAKEITNTIQTVAYGLDKVKSIDEAKAKAEKIKKDQEDLARYNQASAKYYDIKDWYREASRSAVTAEEHKKLYEEYATRLESIATTNDLPLEYQNKLEATFKRDLDFASSKYEGVLKAENKAVYSNYSSNIWVASTAAPIEEKKEIWKDLVSKKSRSFTLRPDEAGEINAKILTDTFIASVNKDDPNAWYKLNQLKKDALDVLKSDLRNANKAYMNTVKSRFNEVLSYAKDKLVANLNEVIARPDIDYNEKISRVEQAKKDKVVSEIEADTMLTSLHSKSISKQQRDNAKLVGAKLSNLDISDEEAKSIAFSDNTGRSETEKQATYEAWKANKRKLELMNNVNDISNVVNDINIPVDNRLEVVNEAIKHSTNDTEKIKLEAQKVKLTNEKAKQEIKHYEGIIKNSKASYAESMTAIKTLEEKGYIQKGEAKKFRGYVETREEKRIKVIEKNNEHIEKLLKKGYSTVFNAHIRDKDRPLKDKLKDIDEAKWLTQAERDMWKSLVKDGNAKEIEKLTKKNLKMAKKLAKNRLNILNWVIKNKEYDTAYKIKKINESKDLSTEAKKSMIVDLKDKMYANQMEEQKKLIKEQKVAYRNVLNGFIESVKQGDYSADPSSVLNAAALGYAGDVMPSYIQGFIKTYRKQHNLYMALMEGKNIIGNDPQYRGVTLKNIPVFEEQLKSIYNSDMSPEDIKNSIKTYKAFKANRYYVTPEIQKVYRIAEVLTAGGSEAGYAKFKQYLEHPSTATDVQINSMMRVLTSKLDLDTTKKVGLVGLKELVRDALEADTSYNEAKAFVEKHLEDMFVTVNPVQDFTRNIPLLDNNILIPRTSYITSKEDYMYRLNAFRRTPKYKDIAYAYPVDYINAENSDWLLISSDGSKSPIRISNADFKLKAE